MSLVDTLLREDLRSFTGYASARRSKATGRIWLNANESPWANPADAEGAARRYPEPQPDALRVALAGLYRTSPENVLLGRGSDEAIDLLVRAFCRPGLDAVVVTPPVFGMYAVSARLQGARLLDLPLQDTPAGFECDTTALAQTALAEGAKLVFLCSPGNPTGGAVSLARIEALVQALNGRALLVVDEAYAEYSAEPSAIGLLPAYENLVVLRTLSKAHALAAARIGCLIARPELVKVLRNCQAPYPLPTPSVALALAALTPEARQATAQRVALTVRERERLWQALQGSPWLRHVYDSQGNYLLVRCIDADVVLARLLAVGVVVRDMRSMPQLDDAVRISVGSPEENDAVIAALAGGATN